MPYPARSRRRQAAAATNSSARARDLRAARGTFSANTRHAFRCACIRRARSSRRCRRGASPPQPDPPAQKPQAEREEKPTLPVLDLSGDHGLTDEQLLVLRTLSTTEPMLTDDLALRTDLPMRRVLSALTILEIDGLTCEAGARCFLRAVELKE